MRYKNNRLQQLRGFCHAARAKSFSKAAELMALSQPSVFLQIQSLEQDLNTPLFERRGPRIKLTREGEVLLGLAQPLVERMDGLEDDFASQTDSLARGSVSIAAGGSTLQYLLPLFIAKFVRENPQVDLRLHNVTGKAGLSLLRSGEVDVAVGPMLETPPDIVFQPIVEYEPLLITSHEHPLAKRKRILLKDIAKYPLILPPRDQSTFRFVETVFAEHGLEYDVKLEVGGYDVIKTYVELGLGISIVMSHCLTGEERLFSANVGRYFPSRVYGLVLRRGRPPSQATQWLIRVMSPDFKFL
jgi:DNA-binding transcriptional LysR family regulator